MEAVAALISRLRDSDDDERAAVREELLALAKGPDGDAVREFIDSARSQELLEIQWELEEVLDQSAPPKPKVAAPSPRPEPAPEPPSSGRLGPQDLEQVYDDPAGLMLHRTKDGRRWFATQVDPRTGQPQTFELHPDEVPAIKAQLAGSPYWILGS